MAKTLITQKTWDQTETDLKKSLRMWGAKEYALLRGLGAGAKPVPAGMKPVDDTPAGRRLVETPQLPPPNADQVVSLDPYEYLGLARSVDRDSLEAMVRSKSRKAAGNEAEQLKINLARDTILAEKGWRGGSDGK